MLFGNKVQENWRTDKLACPLTRYSERNFWS